jgi:UDP-N-acetylglucosamine diphosphorylase / glucose-1-phosphate thymidylyltransferase / UDP-N-acetylgalactosamine diphosphorylase / glucosamine-1-phosphate N-acetyltransferase / galactosamine-1-phosphate N-acetyltransferase
MQIVLFDTIDAHKKLLPLTFTRAVSSIRMGILTPKERWEFKTKQDVQVLTQDYLQALYPNTIQGDVLLVDASVVVDEGLFERIISLSTNHALADANGLIAGRIEIKDDSLNTTQLLSLFETVYDIVGVRRLENPTQIFTWNDEMLRADFALLTKGRTSQPISHTSQAIQPQNIFLEEGASVECCTLNATTGPIYIGKNACIMEGSNIRGSFALGNNATLKMGTKIYGATTIGANCVAGGEIKNSVMMGYSNKAHDGYLGDSVVGEWCNLGAGTSNSNVKNTGGQVNLWNYYTNSFENAGIKCGVIMGDYCRVAINSSINTGSVYGVCCNVFGDGLLPKFLTNFSWGTTENTKYEINKAIQDINNWKQMKNENITDAEIKMLQYIFEKVWSKT